MWASENGRRGVHRRKFLKNLVSVSAGLLSHHLIHCPAIGKSVSLAQPLGSARPQTLEDYAEHVRPLIGTGWHGHTFPGATAPFGLVQLSPDTSGPRRAWYDWDHSSGYHYRDNVICGFSHTHLQGTGAPELGDVLLMPVVGGANWFWTQGMPGEGYASYFSHENESAHAGYYSVYLQTPRVKAEMTATRRCGMHRYTFPPILHGNLAPRGILVDLVHGLGCKVHYAELNLERPNTISGCRSTHGWSADRQVYFVIEVAQPGWDSVDLIVDGKLIQPNAEHISGAEIRGRLVCRKTDGLGGEPVIVRVGISSTSVEGARRNLAREIPGWDFDMICHQTETQWNHALGVLDAVLPNQALTRVFYTAAYHGLTTPAMFNDGDGTWRGQDHKNHDHRGFTQYTTLSIWDIYRGQFPFIMLARPQVTNDIINTLLVDYRLLNQHTLPLWPLWGNETWSMTGFHAVGMILGAYTRGLRGYDVQAVYAAMRDTAMVGAGTNGNRGLQEQFRRFGFVPTGKQRESVSRTLDFAYDYWCVGAMAELLGKQSDASYFYQLANNYKNLFDARTGFMRGKTEDGRWRRRSARIRITGTTTQNPTRGRQLST